VNLGQPRMNLIPKFLSKVLLAGILCLISGSLYAAYAQTPTPTFPDQVSIQLNADKNEINIGDAVKLTLEVRHPQNTQVIVPKLGREWTNQSPASQKPVVFEVRSQSAPKVKNEANGINITSAELEVTIFTTGTFEMPPLAVTTSDSKGNTVQKESPSVTITVKSVLQAGDTNLRDIKPQAALDTPPVWLWILAGVLMALGLAGALWWWLDRRNKREHNQSAGLAVKDTRPPYQIAFDELKRIAGLHLPEQQKMKEYYSLVTDCLRQYLEGQFQVRALERTTAEIKSDLRHSAFPSIPAKEFIDILNESDLVKFAKLIPEPGEADKLMERAHQLVEETHPAEGNG